MNTLKSIILTFILYVFFLNVCTAKEKVTLKGTAVIGNSEMPNVLYVVPWKKPPQPNLNPELHESLIEDHLQPIDRNVFRKKIKHFYSNK